MNTVEKKLTEFKALLGDEAAKKVIEAAEQREAAAKEAGVEVKEAKSTTKDEKAKPVLLSALVADIDAAIEQGLVVNDMAEEEDEGEAEAGEIDLETLGKEIKSLVTETVQKEVKVALKDAETHLLERMKESFLPRTKEAKEQVKDIEAKLKESQEQQAALKEQLDELMGLQPRRNGRNYFRASQEDATVTEKEVAGTAEANPIDTFITGLFQTD